MPEEKKINVDFAHEMGWRDIDILVLKAQVAALAEENGELQKALAKAKDDADVKNILNGIIDDTNVDKLNNAYAPPIILGPTDLPHEDVT